MKSNSVIITETAKPGTILNLDNMIVFPQRMQMAKIFEDDDPRVISLDCREFGNISAQSQVVKFTKPNPQD